MIDLDKIERLQSLARNRSITLADREAVAYAVNYIAHIERNCSGVEIAEIDLDEQYWRGVRRADDVALNAAIPDNPDDIRRLT